ncbi:MAG TPA: DUF423 domain-containing protein [Steroidobacteraceae bacterium]
MTAPNDSILADSGRFATRCLATGAVLMLVAVILGAFGSHVLQGRLTPRQLASFQTGVTWHVYHALALVLLGAVARVMPVTRWLRRAAVLMTIGIVCFAGSIYAMTFGAPRWLGMVAPVGGVCFMLGWVAVVLHAREMSRG